MRIDTFKANFTDDSSLSRDNRFEVSGTAAPTFPLNTLVQNVVLPGVSFDTAMWRHVGIRQKYPYDPIFGNVVVTFTDDDFNSIQSYYNDWMLNKIYTSDGFKYKEDYARVLVIEKRDRSDNTTMTYELQNAFPIELADVALTTSASNTLSTLSVTFTYDYWITK